MSEESGFDPVVDEAGAPRIGLRSLALGVVIVLLGAAPFAFGAVEHWAVGWLRFGILLAVALYFWKSDGLREIPSPARRLARPGIALVLFATIQTVPLPTAVVRTVDPETARILTLTGPGDAGPLAPWLLERAAALGIRAEGDEDVPQEDADARASGTARALSLNPEATRRAALGWLTGIVVFLLASALARDHRRRYVLLWSVGIWTAALGVVAGLQALSWNGLVLWFRARPPGSQPLGPFINPNNLAGYVEMGLLVVCGLGLALVARAGGGSVSISALRAALLDRGWTLPRLMLVAACGSAAVAAMVLSGSRGGAVALGAGISFLAIARRLRRSAAALVACVVVTGVAVGVVAWVGGTASGLDGAPFSMTGGDPSGALRLDAWGKTLRIVADHPIVGTGLGTFEWVFPMYQRVGEWMNWQRAHNDYLQLLSEAGIAGGALLVWALVVFLRSVLLPVIPRTGATVRWTTLGCAGAVFAMMVHSIFDFNLQIPANAALFATLAGVLAAEASDAPNG